MTSVYIKVHESKRVSQCSSFPQRGTASGFICNISPPLPYIPTWPACLAVPKHYSGIGTTVLTYTTLAHTWNMPCVTGFTCQSALFNWYFMLHNSKSHDIRCCWNIYLDSWQQPQGFAPVPRGVGAAGRRLSFSPFKRDHPPSPPHSPMTHTKHKRICICIWYKTILKVVWPFPHGSPLSFADPMLSKSLSRESNQKMNWNTQRMDGSNCLTSIECRMVCSGNFYNSELSTNSCSSGSGRSAVSAATAPLLRPRVAVVVPELP